MMIQSNLINLFPGYPVTNLVVLLKNQYANINSLIS